jgi:hypothetical protein
MRSATASASTDAAIATTAVVRRDLGGGGGGDGEEPFPLAAAAAPGGAVAASGEREARGAFWLFPSAIGDEGRRAVSRGRAGVCSRPLGFSRAREGLLAGGGRCFRGDWGSRDPPAFHVWRANHGATRVMDTSLDAVQTVGGMMCGTDRT